MTILSTIKTNVESNKGLLLETSTVWNIHNTKQIGSTGSNVKSAIDRLFKNKNIETIAAVIGAKGRSQHSATEVLLFDITNITDEDIENAGIEFNSTFFTR